MTRLRKAESLDTGEERHIPLFASFELYTNLSYAKRLSAVLILVGGNRIARWDEAQNRNFPIALGHQSLPNYPPPHAHLLYNAAERESLEHIEDRNSNRERTRLST